MSSVEVMIFDKNNNQEDYKCMARDVEDGKLKVGYIVVEKPWYSPENQWTYWLFSNAYVGFKKVVVDKDSIRPYTQIAKIEWNKEYNIATKLVDWLAIFEDEIENEIAFIDIKDEIPYELWK